MRKSIYREGITKYSRPREPFTEISEMPKSLLAHVTDYLRLLDVKSISIEEMQPHYTKLIALYSTKILIAPFYPFYYRARVTTKNNISELLNPPKQFISRMGRCNDINESLFYCSNCYTTSILEIKPQLNDIVTVLVIKLPTDYDNLANFLPLVGLGGQHLHDELMHPFIKSGNIEIQEKLDLIDNLFTDIFVQDVIVNMDWKYKSSVALTKCAFAMYPDKYIGVAYPSKASMLYGLNFAIQPQWIDFLTSKKYEAFRLRITSVNGDFDLKGSILEIAEKMDSNGNFDFKDVSSANIELDLNESFFKNYEIAFEAHRKTLPKGSFFRRYYPPPYVKTKI